MLMLVLGRCLIPLRFLSFIIPGEHPTASSSVCLLLLAFSCLSVGISSLTRYGCLVLFFAIRFLSRSITPALVTFDVIILSIYFPLLRVEVKGALNCLDLWHCPGKVRRLPTRCSSKLSIVDCLEYYVCYSLVYPGHFALHILSSFSSPNK